MDDDAKDGERLVSTPSRSDERLLCELLVIALADTEEAWRDDSKY
jgi:hypothetical protein